jgi:hypothetical protein
VAISCYSARMSHLYGDSTPFPHEVNYIELCRRAIDCAVQLLSAQHAIATALDRAQNQSQARSLMIGRILAMSEVAVGAFDAFTGPDAPQTERVARRIIDCIGGLCNEEIASLERQTNDDDARTQNVVTRSLESAHRGLEAFVAGQDLPGTDIALSWASAGEQGHTGQIAVRSPFGVSAAFTLAVPADHPWVRSRRVSDIVPDIEVHCPQQSGWLARRVELAPIKLDKLFFVSVRLDGARAEFRLGKSPSSGASYRVLVELSGARQVHFEQLGDDGAADVQGALLLDGEDSANMFRLCTGVVDSMQGLASMRGSIVSLDSEGLALTDLEWPQLMAERVLAHIAPIANEIAQRSGAPGEWVIRRDVGGGRREEIYVTTAELFEKVSILPPERRHPFRMIGLSEASPLPVAPVSESRAVASASVVIADDVAAPAAE